ncbi:MAG: GTPase HflX [Oscillospiraceae bacterium]|nr:GTPase HflX [Oscillospiraceae bacterium]
MELEKRIAIDKAILVGLNADLFTKEETATEQSLDELEALLETAGGQCVGRVLQNRHAPDPHSFVGEGKAQEIKELVKTTEANLLVFDNDLTPSQIRALEEITGAAVLDRSALILDIFAQRAKTREGRLQVELAQYQYLLPRLSGMGESLSRLGGGIGTRGPGESKLETDRRHIRERIFRLQQELSEVRRVRGVQRERRIRNQVPVVAIVGYTNAGKSTLLNRLTGADIPANNRLFDTLDTTTRQLHVSDTLDVLLSDTVGFIAKLPHNLVAAFKATLEELQYADLLLHVIDAGDPNREAHIQVAERLIAQLAGPEVPVIRCYNKADTVEEEDLPHGKDTVAISAKTGAGMDELLRRIGQRLDRGLRHATFLLPYSMSSQVSGLHDQAKVLRCEYTEEGIEVEAICDQTCYGRLRDFEKLVVWVDPRLGRR